MTRKTVESDGLASFIEYIRVLKQLKRPKMHSSCVLISLKVVLAEYWWKIGRTHRCPPPAQSAQVALLVELELRFSKSLDLLIRSYSVRLLRTEVSFVGISVLTSSLNPSFKPKR